MFKNAGKTIRILAIIFFCIGTALSVILGVALIVAGKDNPYAQTLLENSLKLDPVILGIVIIVGGVLTSWISNLLLYGYGKLIEETDKNGRRLDKLEDTVVAMDRSANEKRTALLNLISSRPAAEPRREPRHPQVSADADYAQAPSGQTAVYNRVPAYQQPYPMQNPQYGSVSADSDPAQAPRQPMYGAAPEQRRSRMRND